MNPRITSIENLIASDPGGRNIFGLVLADQLRLAAQSLRLARRVTIVSGFYIPEAGSGETDGPPGAKMVGQVLGEQGITVDFITDRWNAPLFEALGINATIWSESSTARTDAIRYLDAALPTHLLSIERAGRGRDGRFRNMHGHDITNTTVALDELFIEASRRGLTTIGIGDGGNEIGMGKVFGEALSAITHGVEIACTIPADFCIAAGVSNWGAYGLAGALCVLEGRDRLPSAEECAGDVEKLVKFGGAVDGVTHRREPTVDGLPLAESIRMLESIRRQIAPSPFERGEKVTAGVLGYGRTGRAAANLLSRKGHRVCVSDQNPVMVEKGTAVAGVEAGGHTIQFLESCDVVVASPGVSPNASILSALHRQGIAVMSELEMAFQLGDCEIIAITGTVGKRTTVELLQQIFRAADRDLAIGGNRGRPLSELLVDEETKSPIALAVSSFQLEAVVHFRPRIAIMLNIDEAHLDRHRSIAEYVRTKSRIFMNHRADDVLILNYDDERLRPLARKHQGRTLFVSAQQAVDRGAWLLHGKLFLNLAGATETIGTASPLHPENLLSALLAARLSGLGKDALSKFMRKPDESSAPS